MAVIDVLRASPHQIPEAVWTAWVPLLEEADRVWAVREVRLPSSLIHALASDPSARVRAALLSHQSVPSSVAAKIVTSSTDASILAAAAEHAELSDAQFARIVSDPRPRVKAGILAGASKQLDQHPQALLELLEWADSARLSNAASWGLSSVLTSLTPQVQSKLGVEGLLAFVPDTVSPGQLALAYPSWRELWDALMVRFHGDYSLMTAAFQLLSSGAAVPDDIVAQVRSWPNAHYYFPRLPASPSRIQLSLDDIILQLPSMNVDGVIAAFDQLRADPSVPLEFYVNRLLPVVMTCSNSPAEHVEFQDWLDLVSPWFEKLSPSTFTTMLIDLHRDGALGSDEYVAHTLVRHVLNCDDPAAAQLMASYVVEMGAPAGPAYGLVHSVWAKEHPQDVPLPLLRSARVDWDYPAYSWVLAELAGDRPDLTVFNAVERWMDSFTGTAAQLVEAVRVSGLAAAPTHAVSAPAPKRTARVRTR